MGSYLNSPIVPVHQRLVKGLHGGIGFSAKDSDIIGFDQELRECIGWFKIGDSLLITMTVPGVFWRQLSVKLRHTSPGRLSTPA
jgi:hypothetical protein